jgi:hypothetical protein
MVHSLTRCYSNAHIPWLYPSVLMQGTTPITVCHMSFHVNIDMVFLLKCHLCVSLFFPCKIMCYLKYIYVCVCVCVYRVSPNVPILGESRFLKSPFWKPPDVSLFRAT